MYTAQSIKLRVYLKDTLFKFDISKSFIFSPLFLFFPFNGCGQYLIFIVLFSSADKCVSSIRAFDAMKDF